MTTAERFAAELEAEAVATRRLLERVPAESFDWKPHEKSSSLRGLAVHVAGLPNMISNAVTTDGLDFATFVYKPPKVETAAELVALFDSRVAEALALLKDCIDEKMSEIWTMRAGETVYFSMGKQYVIRSAALNHLFHHRGQLTVYLRLLNVPLPGIYGPTADEQ